MPSLFKDPALLRTEHIGDAGDLVGIPDSGTGADKTGRAGDVIGPAEIEGLLQQRYVLIDIDGQRNDTGQLVRIVARQILYIGQPLMKISGDGAE